jgi:hypothetical protein
MVKDLHSLHRRTRREVNTGILAALGATVAWPGLAPLPARAASAKRLAFVITNQGYASDLGELTNTHRDGELVVDALRAADFDLPDDRVVRDADKVQFENAFRSYARRLSDAGRDAVGCLYYSGHGAADRPDGQNYAIPIAARIETAADLSRNALELKWMLDTLRSTKDQTNFVFFDACRDVKKASSVKGGTKGLKAEGNEGIDGTGVVLVFATSMGDTAADNNLFAQVLAQEIKRNPGRSHPNFVTEVQRGVLRASVQTGKPQLPRLELGYTPEDFYFQPMASAGNPSVVETPRSPQPSPQKQAEVRGFLWRIFETFVNGRLYFRNQARMYRQPSRIADQVGMMPAGEEIRSNIEYADAGRDGFWYKFTNNFGETVYVRASDALALRE